MMRQFSLVVCLALASAGAAAEIVPISFAEQDVVELAPPSLPELTAPVAIASAADDEQLLQTNPQSLPGEVTFVFNSTASNAGHSAHPPGDRSLCDYGCHDCRPFCNDCACHSACGLSDGLVRLGAWGVISDGSEQKTGEFQDLNSSPFWDIDMIRSDGVRTWDGWLTGLDNEANDARLRFYGPLLTADVAFQRYLRRWDHDPLTGLDLAPGQPPPADDTGNVISEDLNIGEDYAIRVQELDARFHGNLTNNLKWRLNVWGLRKFGERQSSSMAHCFNMNAPAPAGATGNVCHQLSQRQTVDWLTMEVQPVVEAQFESATIEYSHTLRSFSQDDGVVSRAFTRFGFSPASEVLGPDLNYAIVPDNLTQIDRVRANVQLTESNVFYGQAYYGDTENQFRDTHRQFSGFDARITNTAFDRLRLTTYASLHEENNELPTTFLDTPPLGPPPPVPPSIDQTSLRHPVDYNRFRAGLRSSWRPFGNPNSLYSFGFWDGLAITSGYEYHVISRDSATYITDLGSFTQPDTKSHEFKIGPATQWSRSVNTYVRYTARFIEDPLVGVRRNDGQLNTNQPEFENQVDFGGQWSPSPYFMTTAQVGVVNRVHDSDVTYFDENNFPVVCTVWYAPTDRLSLAGGYGYFSNFIDQDITLGANPAQTETSRWDYTGENHQLSLNSIYRWSPDLRLIAGYEWNWGDNSFDVAPSPSGADWSLVPFLADVKSEIHRATAGVDWQASPNATTYFRYVLFDFDDIAAGLDSGTAHMFLVGGTLIH
jgi:hypothetical protein